MASSRDAKILRTNVWGRLWRIERPQALPLLFTGMKVGITLAVTAAVIGELMGARWPRLPPEPWTGDGRHRLGAGQRHSPVAIGYGLIMAVDHVERRMLRWHESTAARERLALEGS
jgi:NitT/TauT family transport system permease protein